MTFEREGTDLSGRIITKTPQGFVGEFAALLKFKKSVNVE